MMLAALVLLVTWGPLSAQGEGSAGTVNILHNTGPGARAYALGRAYTAIADDPTAVFWNPAGLEYVPRMSLSLYHMPLIVSGASYDFVGFVYPTVRFGTLGFGFARIGVSDVLATNASNELIDASSSYGYNEIYISIAKKAWWSITPGITFKVQRQSFSHLSPERGVSFDFNNPLNSAFGVDLGLLYRPEFDSGLLQGLSLGFHAQNVLRPNLKLGPNDDLLPNKISFGLMKSITTGASGKLNILLNYAQTSLEGGQMGLGSEYSFSELATLRVGYDQNSPAFGAGIAYNMLQIDYSFGNLSHEGDFPPSHRFSLTFNLGKSRDEKVFAANEARKERERQLVEQTREEERQKRIARHMNKGTEDFNEGRYFDAYAEFQQVMVDDPFNKRAKALFDSTRTQIEQQFQTRQQQAISQAVDEAGRQQAIERQQYIDLHFNQGRLHLQSKQFTDALKEFNMSLAQAQDDSLILIINEAINSTNRQKNAEVRRLIASGREEFRKGNYSDAITVLSEALVLSPESPELKREIETLTTRIKLQQYTVQGLALLEIGDYPRAKTVFEEALRLDPANEIIRRYLQQLDVELNVKEEKMTPEEERQYLVATEHFLAGRYEQALEIWKKLAEKYPYNKKLQDAIKTVEDRLKNRK